MMNNGLNWVLLLMLIWARQSLQYVCRQSENCVCAWLPPDEFEMRCFEDSFSTFVIRVKTKEIAIVKCDPMSTWSDFEMNSTDKVEDIETFVFEQCSLPDSGLHEITQRVGFQSIKGLRFMSAKNLSSTLERRHLSGFPKLKELNLNFNGLTELPADLLKDLPELITLEMRQNNVILPLEFFENVPKLKWLELGNNNLTHIDPKLFRSLEKLVYLALYSNGLTHFEENTFENLSALNTLEISRNKLTTLLPGVFKPLRNLSVLQMSRNYFSSLPEDLLSTNLNLTTFKMDINHGNLTTLPSRFFSNLPKLNRVTLDHNKLEVLSDDIFRGSPALKKIILKGNSLSTLPKHIFKENNNLEQLDLSSNRLNHLPDGLFEALSKLEKLELQNNNLTSISEQLFSGLSGLKEINLEYNGLRSIALFGFTHLQELRVARLSHNQLTLQGNLMLAAIFGEQSPFNRCMNLRELHLAHNNITTIFSDWAVLLHKLEKLDLKYNKISIVSADDLQFLSQNILIDIRHNNISKINLELAELIAAAQDSRETSDSRSVRILIEENPILCDCNLFHLLKYLNGDMLPVVQKIFHIIPGSLKCDGPAWMHQIRVSDLNYKTLMCPMTPAVCPEKCECWFRRYDMTALANCSYRSLRTAPNRIVSPIDGKVELDLTGNFLTEVPFINQSGYGKLTKLLLSHNNISIISPNNIPPTLEVLELHNNNLMRINSEVHDRFINTTSLKELTLHENPWKCNYLARDFRHSIQLRCNIVPNLLNITCEGDGSPL